MIYEVRINQYKENKLIKELLIWNVYQTDEFCFVLYLREQYRQQPRFRVHL